MENLRVTLRKQIVSMKRILKFVELNLLRKTVLILCFCSSFIYLAAQDAVDVTGTIVDSEGEALLGATVSVQGTNDGTLSDMNGKFTLKVKPNAKLLISFVGFKKQEVTVGKQTNLFITLESDENELEETVIIGYGAKSRSHLTGSVSTLNVNEIQMIPTGNLSTALAGKMAGVFVAQETGGRPGNAAEITIRARGTWNSTSPLYVIDGVVRDVEAFNLLNANDIEDFSILKDAAAAAVYGARSSNGVVLVTTKKGRDGKARITYSGSVSVGSFAFEQQRQTMENSIRMANDLRMEWRQGYSFVDGKYTPRYSSVYKNGRDASEGYIESGAITDEEAAFYRSFGGYDSYEAVYNTPVTQSHSLNISGGSDKTRYYISGSYYDEPGIAKSLNYSRMSIRANVETNLGKDWKASLATNISNSVDSRPAGEDIRGSNLYAFMVRTTPFRPFKSPDGRYIGSGENMNGENKVAMAEGATGPRDVTRWNSEYNAALEWKAPWIKGLTARVSFSQYFRNQLDKEHYTPYLVYSAKKGESVNNHIFLNEIDETREAIQIGINRLQETRVNSTNYQFNTSINYHNTFGKHEVGGTLVYEQYESSGESATAMTTPMTTSLLPYFKFASTSNKDQWNINGYGWEDARLSFVGRFNYTFDNRYLAEFSFREDASVKFDPKHRWGFFPSGSAAWRVSEEKFFKNSVKFINNLKLRGSVGITGNDAVGAYQWQDRANLAANGVYLGGSNSTSGVSFQAIPNPLITWEKTLSYNGALEMGFLDNTFTFGAEYFFRKTYDILGSQTAYLPDTFGATLAYSNYGIVNSFGYEFEFGFNKQLTKNLALRVKGNFGWADNELVEWAEPGVSPHLSKIGKNWDRQTGYLSDGIVWDVAPEGSTVINGETVKTYTITTSTGHVYRNVRDDYVKNTDATNAGVTISGGGYGDLRPGNIFPVDIHGMDDDGNLTAPDGVMTPGDADKIWMIEHFHPPYTYGLNLNVKWKGFTFDVLFQGTAGNQAMLQWMNQSGSGYDNAVQGWWVENAYSYNSNPTGKMPMVVNGASRPSTNFFVRNSSFLRLKNASISYDIPKKLLSKLGVSNANIYVSGNNLLLLWNSLKYIDPELIYTPQMEDQNKSYINGDAATPSNHTYPLVRKITVGINLTF
jgi:TonB-linked SusC/RagA family outer membrane protein